MWGAGETRPYLQEWRELMAVDGGAVDGGAGAGPRAAPPEAARAAAVACSRLGRPPEALFLAVDLFSTYLGRLVSRGETRDVGRRRALARRAPLRLSSCVRLASKMVCGEDRPLRDDGRAVRSERTVFRALDYRIPAFGIADTVGYLVEMCAAPDGRDPSALHSAAEGVLKLIYLCSREFHSKLRRAIGKTQSEEEFGEFKALLAASVVLTAGRLTRAGDRSKLAERLQYHSIRATSDVEAISDIMMIIILE